MHRRTQLLFTAALAWATAAHAVVEVQTDRLRIVGITAIEVEGHCLDVKVSGSEDDTLFMEPVDVAGQIEVRSQKSGSTLRVWVSRPAAPPLECRAAADSGGALQETPATPRAGILPGSSWSVVRLFGGPSQFPLFGRPRPEKLVF